MFVFFCACFHIQAQNKFTVSGTVKDKQTGELLIGASVKLEGTNINAVTNGYGFYSITAAKGNYTIAVNYAGFKSYLQKIDIISGGTLGLFVGMSLMSFVEIIFCFFNLFSKMFKNIPQKNKIPKISRAGSADRIQRIE